MKTPNKFIILSLLLLSVSAITMQRPFTFLNGKVDTQALNYNFDVIFNSMQDKNFTVATTTPTATDGTIGNVWVLNSIDGKSFLIVKTDATTWKKYELK